MKKLLNFLSSGFVYKSPPEGQGFINFLHTLPTRKLKLLAGTNTHYSKKKLVEIYLLKSNYAKPEIQTRRSSY